MPRRGGIGKKSGAQSCMSGTFIRPQEGESAQEKKERRCTEGREVKLRCSQENGFWRRGRCNRASIEKTENIQ